MAPQTRWLSGPLALALGFALTVTVSAGERRATVDGHTVGAYHREFSTATRPDPPHAVREEPAWGACCDTQSERPWWDDGAAAPTSQSRWWTRHRPDPNRRRAEVPSDGPDGAWSHDVIDREAWRGPDERSRRGWRAGWRGAAQGWGGVWWYGWGADWPAYAGSWDGNRWYHAGRGWRHSGGRGAWQGRWRGEFGFGHGGGDGRRVIALPGQGGD